MHNTSKEFFERFERTITIIEFYKDENGEIKEKKTSKNIIKSTFGHETTKKS